MIDDDLINEGRSVPYLTSRFEFESVLDHVNEIENRLNNVPDDISLFVNETAGFADDAKAISKRWRETSLMLSKHSQLLEFLEIPQMMDTCVRNSCYDEALKLDSYVQRLAKKHGNQIPLIQVVASEIKSTKKTMQETLINDLHLNIQLPTCLKIITYLKRLECYTDMELKFKFLNARDKWLENVLKDIPSSTPLVHLSKLIEVYRINLFDIATQYKAVFPPDDNLSATTIKNNSSIIRHPTSDRDFTDTTILSSWLLHKKGVFIEALKNGLLTCALSDQFYPYESIVDPCFYFGLSMSRIGVDIRPDLVKTFNDITCQRLEMTLRSATDKFENALEKFKFESVAHYQESSSEDDLSPPTALLGFVPLANYNNDVVGALNEIRSVASSSIAHKIRNELDSNILRASDIIRMVFESRKRQEESHITQMTRFSDHFVNIFIPYMQRCIRFIFPVTHIAKMLGISSLEANQLESTGFTTFTSLTISDKARKNLSMFLPEISVVSENTEDEASHEKLVAE